MNDLDTLNSVTNNHSFFALEAAKAWLDMCRFAFDLNPNSTQFADAKARFDLARERCARELLRLEGE